MSRSIKGIQGIQKIPICDIHNEFQKIHRIISQIDIDKILAQKGDIGEIEKKLKGVSTETICSVLLLLNFLEERNYRIDTGVVFDRDTFLTSELTTVFRSEVFRVFRHEFINTGKDLYEHVEKEGFSSLRRFLNIGPTRIRRIIEEFRRHGLLEEKIKEYFTLNN